MVRCEYCGTEYDMPFRCNYCGGVFCIDHRLPEGHECPGMGLVKVRKAPSLPEGPRRRAGEAGIGIELVKGEVRDLTIATLVIFGLGFLSTIRLPISYSLPIGAMVGISYLAHVMGQKMVAKRYRLATRFVLSKFGIALTLISALFPIKFIAPGSLMARGAYLDRRLATVAMVGPLVNIALSSAFFLLTMLSGLYIFYVPFAFNAFIAVFTLIPLGGFDGRLLFEYRRILWLSLFVPSLILLGLATWL